MKLTQQLILVADAYCRATELSPSRVSTLIFNDGKRLDAIREGGDLYTGRLEHALAWFSERWPAEAEGQSSWPVEVPRPAVPARAEP
ncbi:hypothetical protein LJR220_003382 [Bradyrhizobium sp. LjRoot220]|uniref:hypothetical protein n=1 Tax=Bradyrhizobium sp. LjRoot220 TaxID=3342284 RepID=UPI003ECE05D3